MCKDCSNNNVVIKVVNIEINIYWITLLKGHSITQSTVIFICIYGVLYFIFSVFSVMVLCVQSWILGITEKHRNISSTKMRNIYKYKNKKMYTK